MSARQAVETIVQALETAWNRHDAQAFAECFAPDAEFTNVFGTRIAGRFAIESSHAAIFETFFKDSHLAIVETAARFLRPDIAAVDVRWAMTGARSPAGPWPDRKGLLNFVASKKAEGWSIDIFHNMD